MAALTDAQRTDLEKSVAAYLDARYPAVGEAFREASGVPAGGPEGLLEKKWTSVFRLQKRSVELEKRIAELEEEVRGRKAKKADALPRRATERELTGHRNAVASVCFHPLYGVVASCSDDGSILLWDLDAGQGKVKLERTLRGHTNAVNAVDFDAEGKMLASASSDLSVKLWSFEHYECMKTLQGHEHTVSAVQWLGDGERLASASRDCLVKIWARDTGYCTLTLKGHSAWVRALAANTTGLLATCDNDRRVMVWDHAKGTQLQDMAGHTNVVESVCWGGPKLCDLLYSAGRVGQKQAATSGRPGAAVLDPYTEGPHANDWLLLSAARDNTARVWDAIAGRVIMALSGHDNWVRGVVVWEKYVYTCSDDRSLRVWDLGSGRAVSIMSDAHKHFVSCLAVHKTSSMLCSGSVDHSVKVFEMN